MSMFEDGITDVYIDQLRARIHRKEENEKLNNMLSGRSSKAQKNQIKAKGDREIAGLYTYNDEGEILQVNNVKIERLPKLEGNQLHIKEISNSSQGERKGKKGATRNKSQDKNLTVADTTQVKSLAQSRTNINAKSNKDSNSRTLNQIDSTNQVMSEGNFNIKENMKAGAGITYMEGNSHVDKGPTYEKVKSEHGEK